MVHQDFNIEAKQFFTIWVLQLFQTTLLFLKLPLLKLGTMPPNRVCYIGCGVTTGIGAVINTAKWRKDQMQWYLD